MRLMNQLYEVAPPLLPPPLAERKTAWHLPWTNTNKNKTTKPTSSSFLKIKE